MVKVYIVTIDYLKLYCTRNIIITLLLITSLSNRFIARSTPWNEEVARGKRHVAETNVQTACPIPRDFTHHGAQPAKFDLSASRDLCM